MKNTEKMRLMTAMVLIFMMNGSLLKAVACENISAAQAVPLSLSQEASAGGLENWIWYVIFFGTAFMLMIFIVIRHRNDEEEEDE